MAKKIRFENRTDKPLQVGIEPYADYKDWYVGQFVEIELELTSPEFDDDFDFTITKDTLIIYQSRQYEMKLYINKELKFDTSEW